MLFCCVFCCLNLSVACCMCLRCVVLCCFVSCLDCACFLFDYSSLFLFLVGVLLWLLLLCVLCCCVFVVFGLFCCVLSFD